MAAKDVVVSYRADVEATVNRWILDYYSCLALQLFKNKNYVEFSSIRDVLDSFMVRPMELSDVMRIKILVLRFLSRIHDGEDLDQSFESDSTNLESVTPLESALMVLENMRRECNMLLPRQVFEKVCTSLKEMVVVMFIKNNKFAKAKEVLNKHFPKPMVGKKAIFMDLIKRKNKMHKVIDKIDFHRFKEEMLDFGLSLIPSSVPFLHKAATQLIDKRLAEQEDKTVGPDEQDDTVPSSSPQIHTIQFVPCKHTIITRTRLEAAYKALCAGSEERTFARLEEELEGEELARKEDLSLHLSPTPKKCTIQDSEQDRLFQRDSGSPIEASPADQPLQTDAVSQTQAGGLGKTPSVLRNRHLITVARLVVEPDSQGSSQCTASSQELESNVRTEEPPQSPAIANQIDSPSLETDDEIVVPMRKRTKKSCRRASIRLAELSDSEKDLPGSVTNMDICVGKRHDQSNSSLISHSTKSDQQSSDSEEDPQESPASCKTPVGKLRERLANDLLSKVPAADDSSLDSSMELFPPHAVPQTSSTPQKDLTAKWKHLIHTAKESKLIWNDEESEFASRKNSGLNNESTISNSGHRKRVWTAIETMKLKEGVKKFGEGNWSKIKSHYSFNNRTNVNLKDRWRTMKKLNMA